MPAVINRRGLLRVTAGAGSAALLSPWLGDAESAAAQAAAVPGQPPVIATSYAYFTAPEVAFVDAAVGHLIPTDTLGPGAVQAGVTVFIDRQLAGRFGHALDWYMQGPWANGTDEQGYQLKGTPADLYRNAIQIVDAYCRQNFNQKTFATLAAADQIAILHSLEKGQLEHPSVSGKAFFDMLWQNTREGFFADPMYEGNRDFIGWRLVGFPGPRYNYVDQIRHYGERYPYPTVGLLGRDPWRRLKGEAKA